MTKEIGWRERLAITGVVPIEWSRLNAAGLLALHDEYEDINHHHKNRLMLAWKYGTEEEVKEVLAIRGRHEAVGHLFRSDSDWLHENINRYSHLLKAEAKGREVKKLSEILEDFNRENAPPGGWEEEDDG